MTFKEMNTDEYCLNLEKRIKAHFIMLPYIYKNRVCLNDQLKGFEMLFIS